MGALRLKLCYMDTDFLVYKIKTEDFYADIANDILARFDTSGYCPNRPLPILRFKQESNRINERWIGRSYNDRIRGIETKALFL